MKAIVTVIGVDRVGIIAAVSTVLAKYNANILDITQTTMQDMFTMIMMLDVSKLNIEFHELSSKLEQVGEEIGMKISLSHEDIYRLMHRI